MLDKEKKMLKESDGITYQDIINDMRTRWNLVDKRTQMMYAILIKLLEKKIK